MQLFICLQVRMPLIHEGHVRVDVLYTGFSERKKAWTNAIGSLILGIPLCLIVIFLGMGGKASIINWTSNFI